MASIEITIDKCPHCQSGVDMHVLGICSYLGPNVVECHYCKGTVALERYEWWQMERFQKNCFVLITLIYEIIAWLIGGLLTTSGIHFLKHGGEWRKDWGIQDPAFWIGGTVLALVVLAIQLLRIRCSMQRHPDLAPEQEPLRRSLFSFQVCGQIKLLISVLAIGGLCWVVGKVIAE